MVREIQPPVGEPLESMSVSKLFDMGKYRVSRNRGGREVIEVYDMPYGRTIPGVRLDEIELALTGVARTSELLGLDNSGAELNLVVIDPHPQDPHLVVCRLWKKNAPVPPVIDPEKFTGFYVPLDPANKPAPTNLDADDVLDPLAGK